MVVPSVVASGRQWFNHMQKAIYLGFCRYEYNNLEYRIYKFLTFITTTETELNGHSSLSTLAVIRL